MGSDMMRSDTMRLHREKGSTTHHFHTFHAQNEKRKKKERELLVYWGLNCVLALLHFAKIMMT